jgi:hypothetical protein
MRPHVFTEHGAISVPNLRLGTESIEAPLRNDIWRT